MENTTPVDEALHQETFSVLSFIEDVAYPTTEVTLYKDVKAAKDLLNLTAERAERELKEGVVSDLDEQIEAAQKKVADSALTFHLRGYAPGVVNDTMEKYSTDDNSDGADPHLIANAIVSVTNAKGQKDEHVWTAEEVIALRRALVEGEYAKLLGAVADVLFNAAVFETATDAGFLS